MNDARKGLFIEAKKFTRKLILVTTDWRLYEGTARVFRLHPWEEIKPPRPRVAFRISAIP